MTKHSRWAQPKDFSDISKDYSRSFKENRYFTPKRVGNKCPCAGCAEENTTTHSWKMKIWRSTKYRHCSFE